MDNGKIKDFIPIEWNAETEKNFIGLLSKTKDLKSVLKFSKSPKYKDICTKYDEEIYKPIIEKYNIEFEKKSNLLEMIRGKYSNFVKNDGSHNYYNVFLTYMSFYVVENISFPNLGITSVPILPNLEKCDFQGGELKTFPVQPKLKYCNLSNNKLENFPVQPEMIYCNLSKNNLKTFPSHPLLQYCNLSNNNIENLESNPNLFTLNIDNNIIKNIPEQPNLLFITANNCKIENIDSQPQMMIGVFNNNKLSILKSHPNAIFISAKSNNINSIEKIRFVNVEDNPIQIPENNASNGENIITRILEIFSKETVENGMSKGFGEGLINGIFKTLTVKDNKFILLDDYNALWFNNNNTVNDYVTDESSIINEDPNKEECVNLDYITLEPYEFIPNETIVVKTLNSKNKFDKGECFDKNILKQSIEFALQSLKKEESPSDFMCVWTNQNTDENGYGNKPTLQLLYKLPSGLFITISSFLKLLKSHPTKWYAVPIYKKRIGNLLGVFGSSMIHGQLPGYNIYKLYTKEEIKQNLKISEPVDEYSFEIIFANRPVELLINNIFSKHSSLLYYMFYSLKNSSV